MTERFYEARAADGFAAHWLDVSALYRDRPVGQKDPGAPRIGAGPLGVYRRRMAPLRHRAALAARLRRTNVDLDWFDAFSEYWRDVLGGRPLWGVEDFYFLRGAYRMQHQANVVPDTTDPDLHLEAWQRPELLYQVFHQVYYETRYVNVQALAALRRHGASSLLEYGAATAPVLTQYVTFVDPSIRATIADLESIAFHFGAWKFRGYDAIQVAPLVPQNSFALEVDDRFDAICCLTVFEHLNQPLETVRQFERLLAPGGILLFDYALTDGGGLDTQQGAAERDAVLDFIESDFDVSVPIDRSRSVPLVCARKRG